VKNNINQTLVFPGQLSILLSSLPGKLYFKLSQLITSPFSCSLRALLYDISSSSVRGEESLSIKIFENISTRVFSGNALSISMMLSSGNARGKFLFIEVS